MKILVLGASRGLGLEFVRQYRAEGHEVVATARDDAGLARIAALGATAFELDVTDDVSTRGLGRNVAGQCFDLIIVNAGVSGERVAGLQSPSLADFDSVMRTNVLGPMRVIAQLSGSFAPTGAKLMVMSSRMGSIGLRENASAWVYRASKAAANSVLKDASVVLRDKAICVAMHPGWVRTDMGGANADISVEESVSGMRQVLAGLQLSDNGSYLNHDGARLAW